MKFIDRILTISLIFIMVIMSLVVAANVFCRFVLGFSLYWADEVAQICLVWLTFLGAAYAVKERSHYALHFVSEKLSGRALQLFVAVRQGLSVIAILVLFYFSAVVTWRIMPWDMPATEISRAWVYGACPLGCVLMIYYMITGRGKDLSTEKEVLP